MRHQQQRPRIGFTIIELLVVISLIAIMGLLAVLFIPSLQVRDKAARGAGEFQTWLNSARQKAMREQSPRGLRITFAANGQATRAQYIEMPDDLGAGSFVNAAGTPQKLMLRQLPPQSSPGADRVWVTDTSGNSVFNFGPITVSGSTPIFPGDPTVQPGDYLEVNGSGVSHIIINSIQSDKKKNAALFDCLILGSSLPNGGPPAGGITNFRIMRGPRISGDEVFDLPGSIVIDAFASTVAFPNASVPPLPAAGGDFDIMFSPTGSVMSMPLNPLSSPYIVFWVRSLDADAPVPPPLAADYFRNDPTFIVVYVNSGLVAAYPVNPNYSAPATPYDLIRP